MHMSSVFQFVLRSLGDEVVHKYLCKTTMEITYLFLFASVWLVSPVKPLIQKQHIMQLSL